jgi:glycine cleavage system H lipoate-binding protein
MTIPKTSKRVFPPKELRCVWMTAGILTYKLCDHDFECDDCPLNAALRGHSDRFHTSGSGDISPSSAAVENRELRDGYLYTRNHCWAKKVTDSLIRVGLEPRLSHALLTPKAFVLPSDGQRIQRRQTCLWIVIEGGTLPFESPCAGVIRTVNRQLISYPHLLQLQPFDLGWFFELELDEPFQESVDFLNFEEAGLSYASDQSRFRMMLSSTLRVGSPRVGMTLADGGQPLQNIADVIGPGKYFSVLRKAFPP